MNERVLLVAPASDLSPQSDSASFQPITWPRLQLTPLKNLAALDDAIADLYGYDWIIFVNPDAVRFFVERLEQQSGEVSDLDSLRVCAIGEATATTLEHSRVHVDLVASQINSSEVIKQLATYSGGIEHLARVNFLLPQAAIGREYLKEHIENIGARADVVPAYQTVAQDDLTRLAGLQSMLLTSSVDAVIFKEPTEVSELARIFDTNDLGPLLRNTVVLAVGNHTMNAAQVFGIPQPMQLNEISARAIAELLTRRLGT